MKVIAYKDDNGGVTIVYPAYQSEWNQQEQDNFLLFVQNKDVPKLSDGSIRQSWIIDGEETLPTKYVRQAWDITNDGKLYFDMNKGYDVKKDHLRFLRKPFLEKLDIEFMKAFELNNTQELLNVATKKQVLRDITNIDMSQYQTPQDLHNFIPDVLKSTV